MIVMPFSLRTVLFNIEISMCGDGDTQTAWRSDSLYNQLHIFVYILSSDADVDVNIIMHEACMQKSIIHLAPPSSWLVAVVLSVLWLGRGLKGWYMPFHLSPSHQSPRNIPPTCILSLVPHGYTFGSR